MPLLREHKEVFMVAGGSDNCSPATDDKLPVSWRRPVRIGINHDNNKPMGENRVLFHSSAEAKLESWVGKGYLPSCEDISTKCPLKEQPGRRRPHPLLRRHIPSSRRD